MQTEQKKSMPLVTQRIRSIVDANYNGSVRAFCMALGFSDSQKVNRLFKQDSRNGKYPTPSIDIVTLISNKLDVSLVWLQSGEGPMLKESNIELHQSSGIIVADLMLAIKQHGDELRKQGERLDRVLDLVSQRGNASIAVSEQSGLQKSPPSRLCS